MITFLVLIFTLSLDTFIAALSYETNNIKIPIMSNIIISFICSLFLIISLAFGNLLGCFINDKILKFISFLILFLIGLFKIFDNELKKYIKKIKFKKNNFSKIKMIVKIYSDYEKADVDNSKKLSSLEAIFLALALSIDGLSAGLAFTTSIFYLLIIFIVSFFTNMFLILFSKIASHFTLKAKIDFSMFSGLVFIIIGFFRLFN